jgi:hypothetical protein
MIYSILICLLSLAWLIWLLRARKVSLGLPIAYLLAVLLIHVPGAYVHFVADDMLGNAEYVARGIYFTAIASVFFVAGVWWSHFRKPRMQPGNLLNQHDFFLFCAMGGWIFIMLFRVFRSVPSVAALIDKGSQIWILGVLLGLQSALARRSPKGFLKWSVIAAAFPAMTLLFSGFLSRATSSLFMACCGMMITSKSYLRVVLVTAAGTVVLMNLFLNYFLIRDDLRGMINSGSGFEDRIDKLMGAIDNFQIFDSRDLEHLAAFDKRLNQNYFEGLAAARIEQGSVDYLHGFSVWQAVISLVPRAIWPSKPVYGGSPETVAQMTGLPLATNTAWGVGHVMEFQINFGIPGLVVGFFLIGWLLGALDREATRSLMRGDYGAGIMYFLPATGLIFPEGSLVEMASGAAAGLAAAFFWRWLWKTWSSRKRSAPAPSPRSGF